MVSFFVNFIVDVMKICYNLNNKKGRFYHESWNF